MKKITEGNFKNKKVLVRCDFNVPISENGEVIDDFRIKKTIPTINYLLKNNAKIILMTHLDDPGGKVVDKLRLGPIQDKLFEYLDTSIWKAPDCIGRVVKKAVEAMQPSEIILLENLRFHPGEEKNDLQFAKEIASLGDYFINDAFGVCHRNHASVALIPKYLESFSGFLLQEEISVLEKVLLKPKRPLTLIAGGAKISTKIKFIENFLSIADNIILGGAIANTVCMAKGIKVGRSLVEKEILNTIKQKWDLTNTKLHLPLDVIVAKNHNIRSPIGLRGVGNVGNDEIILDIGPDTIQLFKDIIKDSATVIWNGPLGFIEDKKFAKGTEEIARFLSTLSNFRIVGGGETVSLVINLGLEDKFNFISTGGGAMLDFLSGEKLPGLEALGYY